MQRLLLQNIKSISKRRLGALFSLVALAFFAHLSSMSYANPNTVTQGYNNGGKVLQRGTLVSLDAEDTAKVVPATRENQSRIHGVVIAANDSPFTLSDAEEKTFVATVGRYDAFVSTEGGGIQPGDFLSVSTITGIAKKAGDRESYTIGKAIEGFDGSTAVSVTNINNALGESVEVSIGRILVDVSVGPNPLLRNPDSSLPEFLEDAAESIAGKELSPVRVYLGIIIIISAAVISGSLLFSGIRSSMISIGRNPLSKKSIIRSMIQIVISSIIIFLIGIFAVYLLLRL